ncbi:spore coat U domain-containing protein [Novosphingobium sp. AP12]|uniref:Csu type fimbrial protein n=1 Tax=Novosphingobium sp. AP12 TaxID=1144305 RepID=UPI0002721EC0|nr:spore coat U domain-containing protein [Novosphingobium sp. AP12]EJL32029.1 putative secreted protein [Novosphingobium sp. AP12]
MNPTAFVRTALALGTLAGGLVPPAPASAAGCIVCICTVSTTPLSFGTYNPGSAAPTTATATVNANCISVSVPMQATVDLSLSAGTSGNAAARQMASGAARLDYNIYQDSGYSTVWGNGSNGGQLQSMTINNLLSFSATKTAYGRIPARSFPKSGAYTDSIVVTFTF